MRWMSFMHREAYSWIMAAHSNFGFIFSIYPQKAFDIRRCKRRSTRRTPLVLNRLPLEKICAVQDIHFCIPWVCRRCALQTASPEQLLTDAAFRCIIVSYRKKTWILEVEGKFYVPWTQRDQLDETDTLVTFQVKRKATHEAVERVWGQGDSFAEMKLLTYREKRSSLANKITDTSQCTLATTNWYCKTVAWNCHVVAIFLIRKIAQSTNQYNNLKTRMKNAQYER